ncbi:hypothetical protein LF1_22120 [Rubripirellula obstinata]|uniref:Tetratricopeptide repeat protein n=2 Tax=Rubripirellula obstinata TaxID=406547 RepID=A0A5B1CEU3_9BACT|nr:hypothetical protein LF1_22120 [Rubripirellula obstinata]
MNGPSNDSDARMTQTPSSQSMSLMILSQCSKRFPCFAIRCLLLGVFVFGAGIFGAQTASAVDRLYEKSGGNVTGEVTATDKKGVQLKKGSSTKTYLSGEILKILFEGDPSGLTKGREFALDGQYDQALEELKKVDSDSIKREVIKADWVFYTAMSQAKLALAGKGAKDAAATAMVSFAGKFRDSWHIFDAAKLLGDLALALNKPENAMSYYKLLSQSQSPDTKVESVYLQGRVNLIEGDDKEALDKFDKIIGIAAGTTSIARIQTLAKAGKAVALTKSGKSGEGLKLVKELIAELNPDDIEMAARIYNAQGASYEASGDKEGAILAYLHTHLMFSSQPDAHAEALLRLIELWPQVGQPQRAAEARGELQQRYPGVK